MTMEDVGNQVGLNKASLYYYFPNKEALVGEVISSESRVYLDELEARVGEVPGCRNGSPSIWWERFRIYQKVINLHNLSVQDFRRIGPTLKKIYENWHKKETGFIQSIIDDCIRQGELAHCDSVRLARSIVSVANGYKAEVLGNPDIDPNSQSIIP